MNTGDVVIISFPFTDLKTFKARPAIVVKQTPDYNDVIVCLVSSVIPLHANPHQVFLNPDSENNLRSPSVIKTYRITTVETDMIIKQIESIGTLKIEEFKKAFKSLVD